MKYWLYVFLSACLWACSQSNKTEQIVTAKPTNLSGRELAETYCASCHLKPEPEFLDKKTWEKSILPEMSYYLGMKPLRDKMFGMSPEDIQAIIQSNLYPHAPLLTEEDWQKLKDYYITNAPEKPLPQVAKQAIKTSLPFFEVKEMTRLDNRLTLISMVKIDTVSHQLLVSRRDKNLIEIYDNALKRLDSISIESPVSDMILSKGLSSERVGDKYFLEMGIMDPNDTQTGKLKKLNAQNQISTIIDSLRRPVSLKIVDMNEDGVEDFLICNYGNTLGNLTWYDGKTFQKNLLSSLPGARITLLKDMNNDGKMDIIALFCQAREHISIFYNQGKGTFQEEEVLAFSPVYGSSSIDLADMNGDGKLDILYTNGDNADLSMILKNYHGLRIFNNDGQNKFKESYFYPIYGAGQVLARDFDGDGDVDLATIAFFPDVQNKPNEGFLFFENKGNNTFGISTFANSSKGKWLVMDVADMDGDGREDIVLGSFFRTAKVPDKPLSLVWLKNTSKKVVKK
jgi:FG-GAP-like repeat